MERVLLFKSESEAKTTIPFGEIRSAKINGVKVCLVRSSNGIVAFRDECPHMSASLSSGHLNTFDEIICPWHSFRFSLTSGEEIGRRCKELVRLRISELNGKIYLEL